jgi:eukaryotic-like serine/threonine-protein kinase
MQPGYLLRNRYRIEKALAVGGFGETYLAIDCDYPGQPRMVVKHLISKDLDPAALNITRRLFAKEAESLAKLGKESAGTIPELFAHFEENGEFYLVQEFVQGITLSVELRARCLSEPEVLQMLRDILTPLVVVHKEQIVHRDLKPANIIRRDRDRKLVLIDFGAVKEVRKAYTAMPTVQSISIGTPGYQPAEQASGFPKMASDIYAVGVIAIRALTGREPPVPKDLQLGRLEMDSNTLELKWRHLCTVSDDTAEVLNKMVRYLYTNRYADAADALKAIEQLIISRNSPKAQPKTLSATLHVLSPAKSAVTQLFPPASPAKTLVGAISSGKVGPIDPGRRKMFKLIGFGGFGVSGSILLAWLFTVSNTRSSSPKFSKIQFASVRLDPVGKVVDRPQRIAEVFKEDLGGGVFLPMVKIPAGRFMMGSKNSEKERASDEGPQHEVKVLEFYMGQNLLTQAQWQSIMGNNPSKFKGDNNLPVDSVSWLDAMDFCQKLSKKTGKTYRLSSESEWEYACRAGTTTPFAFGEIINPTVVNYDGSYTSAGEYRQKTTAVGSFPPNFFGLYDMHGNLWEWCLDEYVNNYRNTPVDGNPSGDIKTRNPNENRLLRGGSWNNNARNCRSTHRNWGAAAIRFINIGFRVVVSQNS